MAVEVTDASFDQDVLKSSTPVLVDFWAPWCGPCRVLGPIVEELAKDNEGKAVKIVKMNIDENPDVPSQYGVMSIPTLMIFKGGRPVDQMVGVQDKNVLQQKLNEVM
ncbi:MAG: thioredoxin [Candidatus Kerfeldbacteria bacterium]|nr:thioredoxin [Candidatus Kerfeldbacteria bacterium]